MQATLLVGGTMVELDPLRVERADVVLRGDRIGDMDLFDSLKGLLAQANELLGYQKTLRTGRMPEIAPEQKAKAMALLDECRKLAATLRASPSRSAPRSTIA